MKSVVGANEGEKMANVPGTVQNNNGSSKIINEAGAITRNDEDDDNNDRCFSIGLAKLPMTRKKTMYSSDERLFGRLLQLAV